MAAKMRKEVKAVRFGIYLPDEVYKRLRHVAIDENKTATALVRDLIEEFVAKKGKRKGVK
jgi:predicted DNA-binding protein